MKITLSLKPAHWRRDTYQQLEGAVSIYAAHLADRFEEDFEEIDGWVDYEVGDIDDTDLLDEDGWCMSENEKDLVCSRHLGHAGNHAAGGGDFIVAVWPQ